jgi:hypothetical protein
MILIKAAALFSMRARALSAVVGVDEVYNDSHVGYSIEKMGDVVFFLPLDEESFCHTREMPI